LANTFFKTLTASSPPLGKYGMD